MGKRFVKLLMSKGYPRNEAVVRAEFYNYNNVPYKTAYLRETPWTIAYAAKRLTEAFTLSCRPLKDILASFATAMTDAFNELEGDSNV